MFFKKICYDVNSFDKKLTQIRIDLPLFHALFFIHDKCRF